MHFHRRKPQSWMQKGVRELQPPLKMLIKEMKKKNRERKREAGRRINIDQKIQYVSAIICTNDLKKNEMPIFRNFYEWLHAI